MAHDGLATGILAGLSSILSTGAATQINAAVTMFPRVMVACRLASEDLSEDIVDVLDMLAAHPEAHDVMRAERVGDFLVRAVSAGGGWGACAGWAAGDGQPKIVPPLTSHPSCTASRRTTTPCYPHPTRRASCGPCWRTARRTRRWASWTRW